MSGWRQGFLMTQKQRSRHPWRHLHSEVEITTSLGIQAWAHGVTESKVIVQIFSNFAFRCHCNSFGSFRVPSSIFTNTLLSSAHRDPVKNVICIRHARGNVPHNLYDFRIGTRDVMACAVGAVHEFWILRSIAFARVVAASRWIQGHPM